jgi:hypothetical protein
MQSQVYLHVHELIAVGIRSKAFDEDTCYSYWCIELADAWNRSKPLIAQIPSKPETRGRYMELCNLADRWTARIAEARKRGKAY